MHIPDLPTSRLVEGNNYMTVRRVGFDGVRTHDNIASCSTDADPYPSVGVGFQWQPKPDLQPKPEQPRVLL